MGKKSGAKTRKNGNAKEPPGVGYVAAANKPGSQLRKEGAGIAEVLANEAAAATKYALLTTEEERTLLGAELYELNLLEINKVLAGPRGMSMVHLDPIGCIEIVKRCRVSDLPGPGAFTIFNPGSGVLPRFGHTNMLSAVQAEMVRILEADAPTLLRLQERERQAVAVTSPTPAAVPTTQPAPAPPPLSQAERVKAGLSDEDPEDDDEIPSFEDLLSSIKEEIAQRRRHRQQQQQKLPVKQKAQQRRPRSNGNLAGKDWVVPEAKAPVDEPPPPHGSEVKRDVPMESRHASQARKDMPCAGCVSDSSKADVTGCLVDVGDIIEAVGLTSETGKRLNGQKGTVVAYMEDKGRFEVCFIDGALKANRTSLRAANLRRFHSECDLLRSELGSSMDARACGLLTSAAGHAACFVQAPGSMASPVRPTASATEGAPSGRTSDPGSSSFVTSSRPAMPGIPPPAFMEGDCVEAQGLESESGRRINGQMGAVVGYVEAKGRFEVLFRLEGVGAGTRILLKPGNLRRAPRGCETKPGKPGI